MKTKILKIAIIILVAVAWSRAAAGADKPQSANEVFAQPDIRAIDFRNFDYHLGDRWAGVENGLWELRSYGSEVLERSLKVADVQYVDLLGEGREQAVISFLADQDVAGGRKSHQELVVMQSVGRDVRSVGWFSGGRVSVLEDKKTVLVVQPVAVTVYGEEENPDRARYTQYRWRDGSFEKVRVDVLPADGWETAAPPADALQPPALYFDECACPFECCALQEWTAVENMKLYAEPRDHAEVVGEIAPGHTMQALEGIAYVIPGKMMVTEQYVDEFEGLTFEPGDVFYELTYLGEGWSKYWYYGHEGAAPVAMNCSPEIGEACWFRTLTSSYYVWWVRVRTADGVEGWLMDPGHVEGSYGC